MKLSIFYSEQALRDVKVAFEWYRSESKQVGSYFLENLKKAEEVILKSPEAFQIRFYNRLRAYPLRKFPFHIVYLFQDEIIYVLAVFNTSQDPNVLDERLKEI